MVAGATRSAHADWKDGCPAFFPPEMKPDYTGDIKVHGGSASFGAVPELDSPMGWTRVAIEGAWSKLVPEGGTGVLGHAYVSRALVQANLASGPMGGLLASGYDVHGADVHLGNVMGFIGYRHTGYRLGPAFREGFAVRLASGGAETAPTTGGLSTERELVAAYSPYRAASFGVESPFVATIDYRLEMVGCRAPFVDIRVDVSRWRSDQQARSIYDVPIEAAFGEYATATLALYVAIGEDFRSSALQFDRVTRVTFGGDWQPFDAGDDRHHPLRIGFHGSAFTGSNVGGLEIGVAIAWEFHQAAGTLE